MTLLTTLQSHLSPYWQRFLSYYHTQSTRDRHALQLLAIIMVLTLALLLVWAPIHDWYRTSLKQALRDYEDYQWLRTHQTQVAAYINGTGQQQDTPLSLLESVNKAANTHGLTIANLNAENEEMLRLSFQSADISQILKFCYMIEMEMGLLMLDTAITKVGDSERVTVQMTIGQ